MTLLDDLGKTGILIDHHEEFFRKQRSESFFYFIRRQNHVITEIFVNRIIGNNLFMLIDTGTDKKEIWET